MNKNNPNYKWYVNHCTALGRMVGKSTWEGAEMYKKLRRIELKANRFMTNCCNYNITEEDQEKAENSIINAVKRVFGGALPQGFKLNHDPRGYTLKLESPDSYQSEADPIPTGMHKDWGGYGILAPDFTE